MKIKFFLFMGILFLTSKSFALPPCPCSGVRDNCYWSQSYDDGTRYYGEWRDNKRHGQGIYTWTDGSIYVGEWRYGKKHGQGTQTWADDGQKSVGEWRGNNLYEGIQYYASGKVKGTLSNGQWCGGCTPTSRQLAIVEQINSNPGLDTSTLRPVATSSTTGALPSCPSGVFNDCIGTYTWANGNKYVGEWRCDATHGQGTFTWPDGDKYVGEFRGGRRNGQGTYTWADGRMYVGEYRDDRKNGQGTYTFANGDKYVGEFRDEKKHEGIMYDASGALTGTYSNGKSCTGNGCTPTSSALAIVGKIDPSLIPKMEYAYFGDSSCTAGPSKKCLSREAFKELCGKTDRWYAVWESVRFSDGVLNTLLVNHGKSAVHSKSVNVSNKGPGIWVFESDCIFKFKATGTVAGTLFNRTYYCPVWTIEEYEPGKFAVSGIDSLACKKEGE